MDRSAALDFLASKIASAWSPPFRGQIYENAAKLDLQDGYAVKGLFDIATAPHLIEPLRAIWDPAVRVVSVRGAVQTLKSLLVDITVPYWIEHDPGDLLWLLEDDDKARMYAAARAMPLIKGVPEIAAMLEGIDRTRNKATIIRFRHMLIKMCGLNLGNVQSLSWQKVIIDEAWMSRASGLIRQAIDRTKQYPHNKKIILLGQGGIEDEDFDLVHKETDQRVLTYACPFCGYRQPFELSTKRPADFPVKDLQGKYAGLSWETNDRTKPSGRWDYQAVGQTAHYRCYQCNGRIDDTSEMRSKLAASYGYRVTNPGAQAGMVGFTWPGEASTRVPFADQVVKYLRAKVCMEELAYKLPLQEYYQKDRGLTWSDQMAVEQRAPNYEPYDVESDWKEEAYRVLIGDVQRGLARFFCVVTAIALSGEARQLERVEVESFAEIVKLQEKWKVKNHLVFLDCSYEMTKVLRECVKHGHVAAIQFKGKKRKVWRCWNGLKGSGLELFAHTNMASTVKEFRVYSVRKFYDVSVGTSARLPRAPWYEWSNLHCKDLLRARRDADPTAPKFLQLPDTAASTDLGSYTNQMKSEYRHEDYEGGRKRAIWLPIKKTRPNHWWDCGAMLMAVMAILGVIGNPDAG